MAVVVSVTLSQLPNLYPQYSSSSSRLHATLKSLGKQNSLILGLPPKALNDGSSAATVVDDKIVANKVPESSNDGAQSSPAAAMGLNGPAAAEVASRFEDPRWVGGTWDLNQFQWDGKTNWDAVIDAEVRRRKWLEENPEATSNDEPVAFDTAVIPWWAWMKRFHLPEAEKLNGRAAMIGFFMAYLVDSMTGLGVVDQTGNWFCKVLLFVAVAGVLLIRKNEDLQSLKKLLEETTLYDRQWQASWKDEAKE